MRALRYDRYGPSDVLHAADVAEPVPRVGEVKVRVRAASLNPLDWKARRGHLRWLPTFEGPPRGIGCDFAGEIVAVGGGAISRHVGERVFGAKSPFPRDGALAEYLVVPAARTAAIPDDLSDEDAAALPIAGGTAVQALIDSARLAAGQRVVITGAAGGVGHYAVQVAKHLGAHVLGVCGAANVEFVRAMGADEVVDYAVEDFTRRTDRFDVVFDAACASSFAAARGVLAEAGCYLNTGGDASAVASTAMSGLFARFVSRQRAVPVALRPVASAWARLAQYARDGVLRPHLARTIALEDVAEALAAMETGHGRGKIVVRL